MKITQEADYALRVIAYLTEVGQGEIVEAKTIAEQQAIPLRFSLKLLRKLQKAGIVQSYRGIYGGYALHRPPSSVTFKEVIEAIEGPIYLNSCLDNINNCNLITAGSQCQVHQALAQIQSRFIKDLERVNFENIKKPVFSTK
ncbi:RrF2 family transcriptional regulator [Heliorestis convoluta]|uniref:Rrf2 family transcriptional regulator n=1 Tax=Heliorestis convoluta TaxID=356322 RepID=A0A5Q2N298_9FIRM|nr:Rrf2 family transcriptional regulator [Heliorestis convoluta]QGG48947.1 Rrf2 family transcriptional regulator [Heliorestis convoluta]